MTQLYGRISITGLKQEILGRVVTVANGVVTVTDGQSNISFSRRESHPDICVAGVLGPAFDYLAPGDILRVRPDGQLHVLYQANAQANGLLVTERCNHACVMCSQPPRDAPDHHLLQDALRVVHLIYGPATHLVITGGEPTLAGAGLFDLIGAIRSMCPPPSLQLLTNGRLFRYPHWSSSLATVTPPDFLVCVPLYAAVAHRHNAIVQSAGAFHDTVRGILNLLARGIRVEIRVVVHRSTLADVVETARYIGRNLPMVSHVSLMALELTGYTRLHEDALWIDPSEAMPHLEAAVAELQHRRVGVRLYGYQLCVLPSWLRPHAVSAISDWKRVYLSECAGCSQRAMCGGLFASQVRRPPRGIAAMGVDDVAVGQADMT